MIGRKWGSKRGRFPFLGGRWMFRREMGSKRGSLPPKEGDLTCMFQWCSGRGHGPHADLVFWWRGVGIHIERKSRGRIPPTGPSFVHMFIFFCWGETIYINPYCECRQTLLPHFYSGDCFYLFRLGRTGFS